MDGLINRRSGIHGYYLERILSDGASLLDGKISTTFGDKSLQTIGIIAPNCFDLTLGPALTFGWIAGAAWLRNRQRSRDERTLWRQDGLGPAA
ncbi:MAG: hypothetical protein H7312_23045 [Tardiphaga sp.]|nr:hypothetical protein [Tardiphaga sp.]